MNLDGHPVLTVMAAGAAGEFGPVVAISLVLTPVYGAWLGVIFVVSGMNLDVASLVQRPTAMLLAPMCLALFLLVRGAPVLLYRKDLAGGEKLPFALYSATALPLVVAISHVGVKSGFMLPEIGAALVAAGMLSVLLFPTLAEVLLSRGSRNASVKTP